MEDELSSQTLLLIKLCKKQQFEQALDALAKNAALPRIDIVDGQNNNVLHFACFHNNYELFSAIYQHITSLSYDTQQIQNFFLAKNNEDYSPFHLAVYKGNIKMVNDMMKYSLDIYSKARRGLTVLHLASQGNHPHIIVNKVTKLSELISSSKKHYFLEKGMPVDLPNSNGGSALHYAAFSKSAESLMYLLSRGSNLNLQDSQGTTPIYLAALMPENTYIANKLLKRGANPLIQNNEGINAIQAAQNKNHQEMVSLLKKQDGLGEIMNIKQQHKPVRFRYIPIILYITFFMVSLIQAYLFQVPFLKHLLWVILLGVLAGVSFLSFLMSWLVEPGFIVSKKNSGDLNYQMNCLQQNNDDHEICFDCIIQRPPRSKHCEYCMRCVCVYDHHCPWINNCVGADNFLYFQLFIFFTFLYSLLTVAIGSIQLWDQTYGEYGIVFSDQDIQITLHKVSSIYCVIIGILTSLLLSLLMKVQIKNMCSGLTTYERHNGVFSRTKLLQNQLDQSDISSTDDEESLSQKKQLIQNVDPHRKAGRFGCLSSTWELCFLNKRRPEYKDCSI